MKLKLRHRILQRLAPVLIEASALGLRIAAVLHDVFLLAQYGVQLSYRRLRVTLRTWHNRLTVAIAKRRIHYFVEVSEKAKCPACGIRAKHQIAWSDVYQAVMHECSRCKAHWSERPIVKHEAWHVQPMPIPGEQPAESQPKTTTKIHQVV